MATANRKSYASISEPPVLGAPTDTNIRAISNSNLTLYGSCVKGIDIFCKKGLMDGSASLFVLPTALYLFSFSLIRVFSVSIDFSVKTF